jgi:ferredoxin-type protein NapF
MNTISRAQFLRGDWRGHKPELRPPWALSDDLFVEVCDGCGDCVDGCPQHILRLARCLPLVDFSQGECTFCGDCSTTCPRGAFDRPNESFLADSRRPWTYSASISGNCLAVNGTSCVRCIESCAQEAIVARPALRGRLEIRVDDSACNGCGACIAGCPVNAIQMHF